MNLNELNAKYYEAAKSNHWPSMIAFFFAVRKAWPEIYAALTNANVQAIDE